VRKKNCENVHQNLNLELFGIFLGGGVKNYKTWNPALCIGLRRSARKSGRISRVARDKSRSVVMDVREGVVRMLWGRPTIHPASAPTSTPSVRWNLGQDREDNAIGERAYRGDQTQVRPAKRTRSASWYLCAQQGVCLSVPSIDSSCGVLCCWARARAADIDLHSESKNDTKLLPITSPYTNRYSNFFHWWSW